MDYLYVILKTENVEGTIDPTVEVEVFGVYSDQKVAEAKAKALNKDSRQYSYSVDTSFINEI